MQTHEPGAWGGQAVTQRDRSGSPWADLLLGTGLVGVLAAAVGFAHEWGSAFRPSIEIDLSLSALPGYAILSLGRGLIAFVLSLAFTLAYGYWAAKDPVAERVLLPLLDVLQSLPVLGFLPGLVLGLVALFPGSNLGLELASVLMIFTGQVWNMTFSFYHSLRNIAPELDEVASAYGFSRWQRLRWVELPSATFGLVWNGMMSMAGGWFFLMISEAFILGDRDFRLPGLGSYMSVAVARGDGRAMLGAVVTMGAVIVGLDRLLWRPAVVFAQRFRLEQTGAADETRSVLLDLLRRSRLVRWVRTSRSGNATRARRRAAERKARSARGAGARGLVVAVRVALLAALVGGLLFGALRLFSLLAAVALADWLSIAAQGLLTLARVLAAVAIGTLWTVPVGLAIGLSPRLAGRLQPVAQILASFPAPMLFPLVIAGLARAGVSLGWGSIFLMLLGTQWYILFNVIAGAIAIPADLREAARSYALSLPQRFRSLYAPALLPYLVTGWVTAAGGAWNASIVSEAVSFRGASLSTPGLGAQISQAAAQANFPELAASVSALAFVVVLFNRLVWRRCDRLASERFALAG